MRLSPKLCPAQSAAVPRAGRASAAFVQVGEDERVRPQHAYDYSQPPHVGPLNYEAWQWGITGADVCAAFTAFLKEQRKQLV